MNKCIIFAVIAFAAVACASPQPEPYRGHSSPVYISHRQVYAKPAAVYSAPSASAAAAAASSVANSGYLYHVPSYVIESGHSGYSHGHGHGHYRHGAY